jgi:hypothetical protein
VRGKRIKVLKRLGQLFEMQLFQNDNFFFLNKIPSWSYFHCSNSNNFKQIFEQLQFRQLTLSG